MSTADLRFVHDGINLSYRRDGNPSGPAILLLHGLSGISSTYDEVVESLPTFDIYRIDLRGHGRSDRAPGTYQVPFYSGDVVAFVEAVIGRSLVLVGHSLGGVITHHIAATRPDLVNAALCEDPPLYFCDQSLFAQSIFATVFPMILTAMRQMHADGASRDEVRKFVANSPSPAGGIAADHQSPAAIESRVDAFLLCDPDVWEPAINGGALSGYDPDAEITCPITVLQADPALGPALFPDHAERLRANLPHATVALIDGAPHGIHSHTTATARYLQHLHSLLASAKA